MDEVPDRTGEILGSDISRRDEARLRPAFERAGLCTMTPRSLPAVTFSVRQH